MNEGPYKVFDPNSRLLGEPKIDHPEDRYIKVSLKVRDTEYNELFDLKDDAYPGWNVGRIYWSLINHLVEYGAIEVTYREMTAEEIKNERA